MEVADRVLEILEIMRETELWAAEYYKSCLLLCPESERDFFSKLSIEKNKHTQYISVIKAYCLKNPDYFELNVPFDAELAKKAISSIKDNIRRIQKWEIKYDQLANIAAEMEESIIRHRYGKIFKINHQNHLKLLNEISEDTIRHHKMVSEKTNKQ